MLTPDLQTLGLEETLLDLISRNPLDDFIEAMEGALLRRSTDADTTEAKDFYRNTAVELRQLKDRDFVLSDDAEEAIQ